MSYLIKLECLGSRKLGTTFFSFGVKVGFTFCRGSLLRERAAYSKRIDIMATERGFWGARRLDNLFLLSGLPINCIRKMQLLVI